ncbi:MAG: winged helix-turn-helix domain-containing protein [Lachnospiraceae bacterium]|nr:winged helix-turn-helix domain-containing protein [Lachnospiraceae bacterium]
MPVTNETLIYGNLCIHINSRSVYVDEREVLLTKMEFDVLCFLASNPNIAFTKDQIHEAVSNDDYFGDSSYTMRDIIYRLRTKLNIPYIHTLHGFGYKFSTEDGTE